MLNKHARYIVCFGDENQEPYYENKKGTIISYSELELLSKWRDSLGKIFLGSRAENLEIEGYMYYDISKCGIGFHGDSERKR